MPYGAPKSKPFKKRAEVVAQGSELESFASQGLIGKKSREMKMALAIPASIHKFAAGEVRHAEQ